MTMKNRFEDNDDYLIDQMRERPIPEYNHFLASQGYKPYEILQAKDTSSRQLSDVSLSDDHSNIIVDVKVNKK